MDGTKFTKGPWAHGGGAQGGQPDYVYCDDATGSAICRVRLEYVRRTNAEHDANARLIAAAPTLLEALQASELAIKALHMPDSLLLAQIRAAIAKALGS